KLVLDKFFAWGVTSVAFHPNGRELLAAGRDGIIRWWDIDSASEIGLLKMPSGSAQPFSGARVCLAISRDGRHMLAGSEGDSRKCWIAYLFDAESAEVVAEFAGHTSFLRGGAIKCVALAPNGNLAASGSVDCTIRLWDLASRQQAHCLEGHRK